MGTAIDNVYPRTNLGLARRICEKGAIISEYQPGNETRNWHFLERNRLVAGLADVLLIVEASDHSGTLTTAALALDQGKDVFVVPGDITRPMSVGCNRLISQGANVYTEPRDILTVLYPGYEKAEQKQYNNLTIEEAKIIEQLQQGISDGAEIIQRTQLTASAFSQNITILELKGYVSSLGSNKWIII